MSMMELRQTMGNYLDKFWFGLLVGAAWGIAPWIYIYYSEHFRIYGKLICFW